MLDAGTFLIVCPFSIRYAFITNRYNVPIHITRSILISSALNVFLIKVAVLYLFNALLSSSILFLPRKSSILLLFDCHTGLSIKIEVDYSKSIFRNIIIQIKSY